jgi:hypothetical protein
MTYEDKKRLIQYIFGGKDAGGRRLGIYVKRTNGA